MPDLLPHPITPLLLAGESLMTITPISDNLPARYVAPVRPDWVELLKPAAELATQIADTEFVPAEFRNRPGAIAAAILYGAELGLGPMQSLAKIDLVKGRPSPRAELARALALAAGHEIWVDEQTNTRVVMKGHRRGSSHVFTVGWSLDDARKAGIAGNPAYAKYPRQMLLARASAELVRQMAPEVLGGITMFAEEAVDAEPTFNTPTVPAQAAVAPSGTQKRSRRRNDTQQNASGPARAISTEEVGEHGHPAPHPADEDPDRPTEAQRKMAMALFKQIGLGGDDHRDDRIAATGALIGHPITSSNDLNRNEMSTLIDALNRVANGGITFHITDHGVWETIATPNDDDLLD